MTRADLSDIYRGYIACLNEQDWSNLRKFVHEDRRIDKVLSIIDKAAIESQL